MVSQQDGELKAGEILSMSNKGPQQGDIDIDNNNNYTSTTANKSLTKLERQYKAQIDELIMRHKEETERVYAKYDKQKEFISIAAHELRSPITPILGVLELLEYEFEETDNDEIVLKKERFESILRNAKRLERLASEILDISRINDQSLILNKGHFNLAKVVQDAIEDYRQKIKRSKTNTQLLYQVKREQAEEEKEKEPTNATESR